LFLNFCLFKIFQKEEGKGGGEGGEEGKTHSFVYLLQRSRGGKKKKKKPKEA